MLHLCCFVSFQNVARDIARRSGGKKKTVLFFYSLELKRRRQNDMLSKYTSLVTLPTLDHKPSNDAGNVIKHGVKVCAADSLTAGAIISYIPLQIVADILNYAQRRTIQQVSSLHLFSILVVSCSIFEIERGFGWNIDLRKRFITLDCIHLNLSSSVLCLLVLLSQCHPRRPRGS